MEIKYENGKAIREVSPEQLDMSIQRSQEKIARMEAHALEEQADIASEQSKLASLQSVKSQLG